MKIMPVSEWEKNAPIDPPTQAVMKIIDTVRKNGDKALREYASEWDGGAPEHWVLPIGGAAEAWDKTTESVQNAMRVAAAQLEVWSRACLPKAPARLTHGDVKLRQDIRPVASAAVYVPGGRYPLVSSALMGLIPAQVAGVPRRVLMTPAKGGKVNTEILAAAHLGGATEIWAVGGAHGIAAAALGVDGLDPVDLIVGPGNAYVSEAKRQLQGVVAIDMVAGPSELLVIADKGTNLEYLAWDLLAQAEHGPDSESVVFSEDQSVLVALSKKLDALVREWNNDVGEQAVTQVCGAYGSFSDLSAAANRMAPEHLHVTTTDLKPWESVLTNYGSLFLGDLTAVALGDYASGGNHVLPTSRGGRFRGGLSVEDFMVRRTVQAYDPENDLSVMEAAAELARVEGLYAHEKSLRVRLQTRK